MPTKEERETIFTFGFDQALEKMRTQDPTGQYAPAGVYASWVEFTNQLANEKQQYIYEVVSFKDFKENSRKRINDFHEKYENRVAWQLPTGLTKDIWDAIRDMNEPKALLTGRNRGIRVPLQATDAADVNIQARRQEMEQRRERLLSSFDPALEKMIEQRDNLQARLDQAREMLRETELLFETHAALNDLIVQLDRVKQTYINDPQQTTEAFQATCNGLINEHKDNPTYKTPRGDYSFTRLLDNMGKAIDSLMDYVFGQDETAPPRSNAYRFFHIRTTTEIRLDEMLAGVDALNDVTPDLGRSNLGL